jgi:probable F420-dependent oxidoreductase
MARGRWTRSGTVQYLARMRKMVPMGIMGEPDDMAYAALYLASDAARFMTGQTLHPERWHRDAMVSGSAAMIDIGWFGVGSGALADAEGVAEVARAAEELGYESVWVGEHPGADRPPCCAVPHCRRTASSSTRWPCWRTRQRQTTRVKLGTGILILPLRNPVILAKQLATVDVLSKGRLLVGVGVGYVPGEYEAIGVPFGTRGRRADDYIDAMRALWDDDEPRFSGEFAAFSGVQSRPQPASPRLPVYASGMSTAAFRRAVARADGWYGFFQDLDATTRALDELARLAGEVERPEVLGELAITVTPPPGEIDKDTVHRFEDLGVHRLVLLHDFNDMAGGPDPARRALFLADMERTAARLGVGS